MGVKKKKTKQKKRISISLNISQTTLKKILQNPINDSIECLFLDKKEPEDDSVENLFFLVVALELT